MTKDNKDRGTSEDDRQKLQEALQELYSLGSTTHLPTLTAVALLEQTNAPEEIINPRLVESVRRGISGQTRSATAVRNSMQRLEQRGLIERINLRPDAERARYDWTITESGWQLLRTTTGIDAPRSDDPDVRAAFEELYSLGPTARLITLIAAAAIEQQDGSTINVPRIARLCEAMLGRRRTPRTTYHSVDELAERGLVEKRDIEPESNRLRMDVRLSERGWGLLQSTQMIRLAREWGRRVAERGGSQ